MSEEREIIIIGTTSALHEKQWAVLDDDSTDSAHCDLTYQEAEQLLMALKAQGHAGLIIVSNDAGKRARERGYLRTAEQN